MNRDEDSKAANAKYLAALSKDARDAQLIIWDCVDDYGDVSVQGLKRHVKRLRRDGMIVGFLSGTIVTSLVLFLLPPPL